VQQRQLTFFSSTAFLTAFSRADRPDRPVLTSMNTISISSTEALSPFKGNQVDQRVAGETKHGAT